MVIVVTNEADDTPQREIPVGVNLIMTRHSWHAELEPHRPHELLVKKSDVCPKITLNPPSFPCQSEVEDRPGRE